jgi:hypothetical protein
MSMIGKLRQVSEFDLAKYKKNPGEIAACACWSATAGWLRRIRGAARDAAAIAGGEKND